MSLHAIVTALGLPPDSRVDQRIPKKLLIEQGAPVASDKRLIQDGIDTMQWIAALKPTTIGMPVYRDDQREYLEIAMVTAILRTGARTSRLSELIHRAIPYPTLLVVEQDGAFQLSLGHKRSAQNDPNKLVLEGLHVTPSFRMAPPLPQTAAFLASCDLALQPNRDLHALYQGWIDRVTAFDAALITGTFAVPMSPEQADSQRADLDAHQRLQSEIKSLRAKAAKEKQVNRRVDLNIKIKKLETEMAIVIGRLGDAVPLASPSDRSSA